MTAPRKVTERDLRAPEFQDCEPEDMEWRADGTLARKDRWEQGMRTIASIVGIGVRGKWEIAEVVEAVKKLRDAVQRGVS